MVEARSAKSRKLRPFAHSLFSFLSFKRNDPDKLVTEGILNDYQMQIRELQVLLFSLKTERIKLLEQLNASKQTIKSLKKTKLAMQQSFQNEIASLRNSIIEEKERLELEYGQRLQKSLESEREVIAKSIESEKHSLIEDLKRDHRIELKSKDQVIQQLQSTNEKSQLTIHQLKAQVREKSELLAQSQSQSQMKELDHAKTIEDLKKRLRIQSMESKQSQETRNPFLPSKSIFTKSESKTTSKTEKNPLPISDSVKSEISKNHRKRRELKKKASQISEDDSENKYTSSATSSQEISSRSRLPTSSTPNRR